MIKNYIENANFEDTGFAYTLSLISGKHKMVILYCLMEFETVRFNELKRYLKTISDKTLSTNLKELEKDRLIIRTEYPQIPPKVEGFGIEKVDDAIKLQLMRISQVGEDILAEYKVLEEM